MRNIGYYNGKIGLIEEMTVPMTDRACYFGDGVYDATYSRNKVIYMIDAHLDRFFRSAGKLNMTVPCSKDELANLLIELAEKVDDDEQFVYWQLSRGSALRNHVFPAGVPGNVVTANKTGELAAVENDTAIIWGEDTTYILCVMSSNLKNTEEARKEIVKISETVYAALNGSQDSPA